MLGKELISCNMEGKEYHWDEMPMFQISSNSSIPQCTVTIRVRNPFSSLYIEVSTSSLAAKGKSCRGGDLVEIRDPEVTTDPYKAVLCKDGKRQNSRIYYQQSEEAITFNISRSSGQRRNIIMSGRWDNC